MNAPTKAVANPLIDWLLEEGWRILDPNTFTSRFAQQIVALGLPVCRIRTTIRILHPQVVGTSYTWQRGADEVEEFSSPHSVLQTDMYLKSPFAEIFEGAGAIRRRLDIAGVELDYPILEELRDEGATDYVAMPIEFSDGKISAITFAGDRAGGFSTNELELLYNMLPALGRIMEVHALRHTARSILNTYLGKQSGERVLNGSIKRGDGDDIHAIIWFCDLRGSTPLADSMPREEFLDLLNAFFECMAGAVLDHGGEVLRFIGDAVLAIFPIQSRHDCPEECPEHQSACRAAVDAAQDAIMRIAELNNSRRERGEEDVGFGIGLHLGEVMYGNIGVPARLEFSVIGAAANEAARIESMCKTLDRQLLISADLARVLPENWISMGLHTLRGVGAAQEIFTLADQARAA
ncbi:MAG: adenylate/guanylate cyclase domain-containing protein [Rhodospirillales bacterium]|jgi:adenylate cyclase|nr:adenylate/guanylate cyclase domain-containing protein [Rhodospirillales bacterium]